MSNIILKRGAEANLPFLNLAEPAYTTDTKKLFVGNGIGVTLLSSPELFGGANTAYHFHDSDRNRANHTGTQLASTISDFSSSVNSLISAASINAVSLGGIAAANYARLDINNSFAGHSIYDTGKGIQIKDSGGNTRSLVEIDTDVSSFGNITLPTMLKSNGVLTHNGNNILDTTYIGEINGVASLDATGKLTSSQLPATINASTLNSLASSQFARVDLENTFDVDNRFNNNRNLWVKTLGGVSRRLARMSISDVIEIGDVNSPVTIQASALRHGGNLILDESMKGVANGLATLDSTGLIPTSQLPSYVDDVIEVTSLPGTGETGKIYLNTTDGSIWRWGGSSFIEINTSVSSADTAVKLATARTISLTGNATGSVSFDGSANVSINTTVNNSSALNGLASSQFLRSDVGNNASGNLTIENTEPSVKLRESDSTIQALWTVSGGNVYLQVSGAGYVGGGNLLLTGQNASDIAAVKIMSGGSLRTVYHTGNDSALAHLSTNEIFDGIKTFSQQIISTVSGAAPFSIASTNKVINLNADLLEGFHGDSIATANTVGIRDSGGALSAVHMISTNEARVGNASNDTSFVDFHDNDVATYRSFGWNQTNSQFEAEDVNGVLQKLWTAGNDSPLAHLEGSEIFLGQKSFALSPILYYNSLLNSKNSTGTAVPILGTGGSNEVLVGNSAYTMSLRATDAVATGYITIPNDFALRVKNLAGSSINAVRMNGSNVMLLASTSYPTTIQSNGTLLHNSYTVWTSGNQGHNSGLVADTVDDLHGSQLMRSDTNTGTTGYVYAKGFAGAGGVGGVRISQPGGASYFTQTSSITGAIKITLPVSWTGSMLRMTIKIYEYTTDESFEVVCGGYNSSNASSWANCFAYILSSPNVNRNFPVRFGHDGTNCCIYIGDVGNVWSYPQVFVTEFECGCSGISNALWNDGWSIGFVTSFGTLYQSIGNSEVGKYTYGYRVLNTQDLIGLDAATLETYSSSSFFGPSSEEKMFCFSVGHSGVDAYQYEIVRLCTDLGNWTNTGKMEIEIAGRYYNSSLVKRYSVHYSQNTGVRVVLIGYEGYGGNYFQLVAGDEVVVSGDITYIPLYVQTRYYTRATATIRTTWQRSTSNPPSAGRIYVFDTPVETAIATFTADSQVEIARTSNLLAGGATLWSSAVQGNGTGMDSDLLRGLIPTTANTADSIVQRGSGGNFSAGTITAALAGNASTATKLLTARTITLAGDLSGSVSFDGSANVSITAAVADDSHAHIISNVDGLQTALDAKIASTLIGVANGVASLDSSGLIPSTQLPSYVDDVIEVTSLPGTGVTGKIYVNTTDGSIWRWGGSAFIEINQSVASADTAVKLAIARTISLTGDVSGSTSFDGSANVSITTAVADDSHNHSNYLLSTATATDSDKLDGLHKTQLSWGNAYVHNTWNDFNSVVGTWNFGVHHINGTTNGPGHSGASQYYHARWALGSDYSNYSLQLAIPREVADAYLYLRYEVAGVAGSWYKMRAGYADNCGTLNGQLASYYLNASNINAGTIDDAYLPGTITSNVTGNAATATKLATARSIALAGDLSGSANFDGSAGISITAVVADDSHAHIISNVDGLQTALDSKLPSTGIASDSSLLTGYAPAAGATGDTIALRNASGDLVARYFTGAYVNVSHSIATRSGDTVFYSSTDNYIRKNSASGFRASLGVLSSSEIASAYLGINATAVAAAKLATARTLSLSGDVSGSTSFDGSGNASITTVVADNSHLHTDTLNGNGNYIVKDTRDVDMPTAFSERGVSFDFKSNSADGLSQGGSYHGTMTFQQWMNSSGGYTHEVGFTQAGLYYRNCVIGGTWGAWKRLLDSGMTSLTANLIGNADTATKLATARTLSLTGDVSGSTSFDGSANVSISAVVANDSHSHSNYLSNSYLSSISISNADSADVSGITAYYLPNTASNRPFAGTDHSLLTLSYSNAYSSQIAGDWRTGELYSRGQNNGTWTSWYKLWSSLDSSITASITGNAATASKLATARTITLSGDLSGSTSFDGSGNVSITAAVADDSHNHIISNVDGLQTALNAKIDSTLIGVANGVASLDSSGLIPTAQLPSYVDDVIEVTTLPGTGTTGKIYVNTTDGSIWRWTGSAFIEINTSVASADTALKLATARTIALAGDLSGSAVFDGSANISITAAVADDSHNHIIGNVDGLQTALNAKLDTTATAAAATKLETARTVNGTNFDGTTNITTSFWGTTRTFSLSGDVSGSASVNGSANVTITAVVADDSHNHIISNVDGLQTALDNKLEEGDLVVEQNSVTAIADATNTVSIVFVTEGKSNMANLNYTVFTEIENTTDINPCQFGKTVTAKATTGFTLLLSGLTDSANYKLNWTVRAY